MSFTLELTDAQEALRSKTHAFARDVIRPAAADYDRVQEQPWSILQEAARQGLYTWELYAELSVDPTGLWLPILMEELFWGQKVFIGNGGIADVHVLVATVDPETGHRGEGCSSCPRARRA